VVYFQVGPSLSHRVVNVFAEVLGDHNGNYTNFIEVYINLLEENALRWTSGEWIDIQVV
jgi:hypothetical protein